jgi:hypothetical protein
MMPSVIEVIDLGQRFCFSDVIGLPFVFLNSEGLLAGVKTYSVISGSVISGQFQIA